MPGALRQLSSQLRTGYDLLGVRGLGKSAFHSLRHTDSINRFAFTPQVITSISADATFEFGPGAKFLMGASTFHASHPKLGRSKFSITSDGEMRVPGSARAEIGPCSVLHVEGCFEMGSSYVNSDSRILCADRVSIGDGCALAWNVEILDDDRHELFVDGERKRRSAPIRIEDNVWVGHDVTIKKGVTIGEGAVVASDSTVTSDVPAGCLAAGSPATVIADDVRWES